MASRKRPPSSYATPFEKACDKEVTRLLQRIGKRREQTNRVVAEVEQTLNAVMSVVPANVRKDLTKCVRAIRSLLRKRDWDRRQAGVD